MFDQLLRSPSISAKTSPDVLPPCHAIAKSKSILQQLMPKPKRLVLSRSPVSKSRPNEMKSLPGETLIAYSSRLTS